MKMVAYEKIGMCEQAEYDCPQRWTPLKADFRINAFAIHEVMPPLMVDRPEGTGDWLFILFHDAATVVFPDGEQPVKSGSLVLWPSGAAHVYGQVSGEWDHSWIHFDGSWAAERMAEYRMKGGSILKLEQSRLMESCLWQLYMELMNHVQPDPVILKNIFHNGLREFMRDSREGASPVVPEKILGVKQYLDQHTRRAITLKQLAEKAELSVSYLCAEFRRYYGDSPIRYLIGLRLEQARCLLADRTLSVAEVARRVGYEDVYHFSKLFKKQFGSSPRTLRSSRPPVIPKRGRELKEPGCARVESG